MPCNWRSELPVRLARHKELHGTTLPFGSGLSYGDSCLAASDRVLALSPLDRFVSVDWSVGILIAEAGTTLEQILAIAIPQGWFLPVSPGTKYVTLGGAIANDVHGKNHHRRGTFGRHVRQFGLLRSDTGRVTCSPTEHVPLFQATIGGLGLTGIIEWAEIQLMPIRSSRVTCLTQRFGNIEEFFALSAELDEKHEFSVSWIDCAARGKTTGRGVFMAGDFSREGGLMVETSRKLTVPFTPPASLVNSISVRAFNALYWSKAPHLRKTGGVGYDRFLYPLDGFLKWNRIYGRNGFQQYQCLMPEAAARTGIHELLSTIGKSGTGSFLAVLKRCGNLPSPGLLSFPGPGTTLALDFPQTEHVSKTLFPALDSVVRSAGGRIYPAKDAHMSGEDFRRSYPAWSRLETLRDPALLSRFWERVIA